MVYVLLPAFLVSFIYYFNYGYAITQSTVIESTTEISSLEGTSPRQTASTSAHTVLNILIADYGREREKITVMIHDAHQADEDDRHHHHVADLRFWDISAVSIVLHIHVSFYCVNNSITYILTLILRILS